MSKGSAVNRFCRLPTPSYEKIYADANSILDDIISQCHTFRKPNQNNDTKEMISLISHGCEILQNASILLKSKFAQVINIYLPVIKNSINENFVNKLILFLCSSLTNSKSTLLSEFMKALALTLVGNGAYLNEESLIQLLGEDGVIWLYLPHDEWVVKGYAIQCLGNVCLKSSDGSSIEKEYVRLCYSKLLDCLRLLLVKNSCDIDNLKLINLAMKALQNVLSNVTVNHGIVEPEFAVALLKTFLAYGMPGYQEKMEKLTRVLPNRKEEDIAQVEKIYPTKKKEKSHMTKKLHAKKTRRSKKKAVTVNLEEAFDGVSEDGFSAAFSTNWHQMKNQTSSSESDFSDTESGQRDHLKYSLQKIRYNAAVTLKDILMCCDRRSKFSCWLILVPDSLANNDPSLVYSLAMDHSEKIEAIDQEVFNKIQTAIILALMELIDGSKGFLDSAVSDISRSQGTAKSFTPFSVKLSQSLTILHDTLLSALDRRQPEAGYDKLIKCLTLFMLNAPYRKIGIDYLPDIVCHVCKFLKNSDVYLIQSVLTCLAASMSVEPSNDEVMKIFQKTAMPSKTTSIGGDKKSTKANGGEITEEISWLVIFCLQQLVQASQDAERELKLASECIQLLTVILRCHPTLIKKKQRDRIISLSINCFLFSSDPIISFHTIKILEEFSKYYVTVQLTKKDDKEGEEFWKNMLTGAIPEYLHSDSLKSTKGQAAVCDWISNMGASMFEAQKSPEQIYAKTVLIGLAASEEAVLAAAAVRALGVMIQYPCMRDDVWFVVDVTRSILQQLDNPSVCVRLKAAWSLANLIDFVTMNGFLDNEYPESLILKLLQYSTKASLDNIKVSTNGVRALGNLLKLFPQKLFEGCRRMLSIAHKNVRYMAYLTTCHANVQKDCFKEGIEDAVAALIKNTNTGSSMKNRWNACYACRYIFDNKNFPIGKTSWTVNIYSALLEAFECRNFKVRTSAVSALCSPSSRSSYGDEKMFARIWREALLALEKSEDLTDFTEFKHKDNLQNQLTMLLLHLLSLCTGDDLKNLRLEVQQFHGTFLMHCERCVAEVESKNTITLEQHPHPHCATAKNKEEEAEANFDDTLELAEIPSDKISEIEKYIQKATENLCSISSIKNESSTMEIIRQSLYLVT